MARVYLISKPAGGAKLIYTIDQAVGASCPNLRDDVALVQFLLRAAMEDDKAYQIPAGAPLLIDGICGPQTISYLKSCHSERPVIETQGIHREIGPKAVQQVAVFGGSEGLRKWRLGPRGSAG